MIPSGTPAIVEVSPAPAATPAVPVMGIPAFDAILMLQNLAATADSADIASLEAGETAELVGGDDSSDDEENAEGLEASLAFLSELLAVTSARSAPDFEGGSHPRSQDESAEQSASTAALKAGEGALLEAANDALIPGKGPVAEPADEIEALMMTPAPAEPLEARTGAESTQNLARVAELLTGAARPGVAAQDKPTLVTHARDPRWAEEFGARVSLMVRAGESTASLQLTPVDLGPVEVNVTVRESQATVHFGASQAETRALIEASLPKLRELLASQGYQLTDASVSSGFARSQDRGAASPARAAAGEAESGVTEAQPLRSLSLLDVYA